MDDPTILTSEKSGVLHVMLNRPRVKNAMSLALLEELLAALDRAEADPATRVIVIRGAEGNFSAGADIKDMAAARKSDDPAAAIRALSIGFGRMVARFATTPKTVITALEGAVMGGGFGLACASDIAIAAPDVRFALPEATLGLVPAQIAPVLLERIGYSEAKRLSVAGRPVGAEEALTIGLVHEIADNLSESVESAARSALRCAPHAVANSKALLRRARFAPSDSLVEEAADLFTEAVLGKEGREGTAAFNEKRRAAWMPD